MTAVIITQTNFSLVSDLLDDVTYHLNFQITLFSGFLLLYLVEAKVKYRFTPTSFQLLDACFSITWPLKYMQSPLTCPFNIFAYQNHFNYFLTLPYIVSFSFSFLLVFWANEWKSFCTQLENTSYTRTQIRSICFRISFQMGILFTRF